MLRISSFNILHFYNCKIFLKISFSFATFVEYNLICEQFEKIENFSELQNYFRLREKTCIY